MSVRQFLLTLRIVLVSFTCAALVFALNSKQTMYDMVQNAYTVTLVAALVPLAAGKFFKRENKKGAIPSPAPRLPPPPLPPPPPPRPAPPPPFFPPPAKFPPPRATSGRPPS